MSDEPRYCDFAEAAKRLAEMGVPVPESWLRRHSKELPRTRVGRLVRFSEDDLARIPEIFHREPENRPAPQPAATGTHPLSNLRPLPRRTSARAA